IPTKPQLLLALLTGVIYIFALFWFFMGLEHFEPSRIVPAIGGILPLFTFTLVYFFSRGEAVLGVKELFAFAILILGSFLITFERKKISFQSLKISILAAFLFALVFVLSKYVYLAQSFWSGFIWMRIGGFLAALCFLLTKTVREEIFLKKFTFQKKTGTLFLFNQGMGAGGFILQNFAIALAGLAFLPFINALQGIQYVFLFLIIVLLARKFPRIVEEKLTKRNILQKVISIALIGLGLIILYF
ncbi:hypothetical protein KJA17_00005, partial [Patescibacteria group bacterium]|nr:hypothetical protein [Patescibacteria group bacterium]